ncbi:hypothetical protein Sxan_03670 [Streptomyces xanthophaeus]|uniref:Uncharacterized protein n=1 Tax=Streptomyces xanthophaeus TaxID=67385 RepID=A0A919GXK9_9ACTN|nr:hypothetical protein Sxan_03670 [Streptomyces xanthophaeus]
MGGGRTRRGPDHDRRALATGALLGPEVWAEATRNPIAFVFAGNCNGPGEWRYALGFVESGGFIGGEGNSTGHVPVRGHLVPGTPMSSAGSGCLPL